jgi:hypothetical protein
MGNLRDSPTARATVILTTLLILIVSGRCGYKKCSGAPEVDAAQTPEELGKVLLHSFVDPESQDYTGHALRIRDLSWMQVEMKKAGEKIPQGITMPAANIIKHRKKMVKSWRKVNDDARTFGLDLSQATWIETGFQARKIGIVNVGRLDVRFKVGDAEHHLVTEPVVQVGRGWIFAGPVSLGAP